MLSLTQKKKKNPKITYRDTIGIATDITKSGSQSQKNMTPSMKHFEK